MRQLRKTSGDVPGERHKRRDREDVQQHERRFRRGDDLQRQADEQRLQRAWNLALRPDHVRAEIGPLAGCVVAQPHQVNLGVVFEEELARQPVDEAIDEEPDESAGRDRKPAVQNLPQCQASAASRRIGPML